MSSKGGSGPGRVLRHLLPFPAQRCFPFASESDPLSPKYILSSPAISLPGRIPSSLLVERQEKGPHRQMQGSGLCSHHPEILNSFMLEFVFFK